MLEKEIELTNILNKKFNLNLINSSDKFSFYDAYNKDYIVEYKIRNKHYQDQFIQVDKLYHLLMTAEYKNKIPGYTVTDNKGIFIYNLIDNIKYFINAKIIVKSCPYQTEFENDKKINKYFYILKQEHLKTKL
jgi:hypothetical protein